MKWEITGAADAAVDPRLDDTEDPGMAVKMTGASFATIGELAAGGGCDERELLGLCDFVDQRIDCSDFRLLTLLQVRLRWYAQLGEHAQERLDRTILGFRYWMDEPGDDSMCFWSENHQCIFATCEYLAGQVFPDATFTNAPPPGHPGEGLTGRERMERAAARLHTWLGDRFRFGFTEWLSNTYYEEDVAPLTMLVEHCADEALVTEATMVLDLLMLDLALHRFDGRFVGSAGRCYEAQKCDPATADVNDIMQAAFGAAPGREPTTPDLTRLGTVFLLRERYQVPEAVRAIAAETGDVDVEVSHGLELAEVRQRLAERDGLVGQGSGPDVVRLGLFFWLMEAFTNAESVVPTIALFRRWKMRTNSFLAPMAPFARLPKAVLPSLVKALNPATQGVAIQRADVRTTRRKHWMLSAAQRHHPREYGDQQHIWQATLPGDITVFSNHPGAPMFDDTARGFSPAWWVGNGRNPDVVTVDNVLLAVHDLSGRGGYLETERMALSHLWWPADRFDEVRRGRDWVCGRRGDSLIGVRGLETMLLGRDGEMEQHGALTVWGVICSDLGTVSGGQEGLSPLRQVDAFAERLAESRLLVTDELATWQLPDGPESRGRHTLRLHRDGPALLDDQPIVTEHPRLRSPFGEVPRFPEVIEVVHAGQRLRLDWASRTREMGRARETGGL